MKGQHAHQHALHKERLNHPLIKRNGQFVKVTWQEALDEIKARTQTLQTEHGNDAISVYGSASITNEEAYLLGKFARVALKRNTLITMEDCVCLQQQQQLTKHLDLIGV